MVYLKSISYSSRIAVLMLLTTASAAHAAGETIGSNTEVIAPVTLTKTQDLDFGTIAPSDANGRVTINARTGNRTGNANVTLIGTDGQRGLFTITAEPRTVVTLSGGSFVQLDGPAGQQMVMNRLRVNRNNGGQRTLPRDYNIPGSGTMSVGFGGRLRVNANQAAGSYTGNFDLTVEYQ